MTRNWVFVLQSKPAIMQFNFQNLTIGSFWPWTTDIVAILLFFTFLVGHGDLPDLAFVVFVIFPRLKKFNELENGLIGFTKARLQNVSPPSQD